VIVLCYQYSCVCHEEYCVLPHDVHVCAIACSLCWCIYLCVITATEWAAFVKQKQREGTMDLKQQLENLQRQLKGYKTKKLVPHAKHSAALSTTPHKASMSPDKPTPPPKPRRLHALAHADMADSAVVSNSIGHSTTAGATTSASGHSNATLRTESAGANAHAGPKSGTKASIEARESTMESTKNGEASDFDHSDDESDNEEGDELAEHESSKYHVAKTDYGQIQVRSGFSCVP
jgi:cytoskeletal protein RodZ